MLKRNEDKIASCFTPVSILKDFVVRLFGTDKTARAEL